MEVDDERRHGYPTTWVLAIGVKTYNTKICGLPSLDGAVDDAEKVSSFFDKRGCAYVETLLEEEATPANVEQVLREWHKPVGPKDLVIVYFSGHGQRSVVDLNSPNGPRTEGVLCMYGYVGGQSATGVMRATTLWQHMQSLRAVHKLMLFDCCYPGNGLSQGIETDNVDHWPFLVANGAAQVLAAAASDERSFERLEQDDQHRAGVFTQRLLEGLSGAAFKDTGRDWLRVDQLCAWLLPRVRADTQGRQTVCSGHPSDRLRDRGRVIFVRPGAILPLLPEVGAPAVAPQHQHQTSELTAIRFICDVLNYVALHLAATRGPAAAAPAVQAADRPMTQAEALERLRVMFDLVGPIVRRFEPPMCRHPNPDGRDNECGESKTGHGAGCWCSRAGPGHGGDHRCGNRHIWPNRPQPPPPLPPLALPTTTTTTTAAAPVSSADYQCTAHHAHGDRLKQSVNAVCSGLDLAREGVTDYIATKLTEMHRGYFWTVIKGASEVTGRWCMAKFELSNGGRTNVVIIFAHLIHRDCDKLAASA